MNEEQTVIRRRQPVEGWASSEVNAYLIVLSGRSVGKMFKVPVGRVNLGRSLEADVRLEDEGVSRIHANMERRDDGTVLLNDNGSTNGTYVNGTRVSQMELSDGDRIQVGSVTILKFSYQDSLEEQFQQQLYESATRDPLTQAYNKRFFTEQMEKDFSHASRHNLALSLVIMDVDHFKKINDTHGHPAGDHVLQRLAAAVMGSLRAEDAFCRMGGEEFCIIMRDCAGPEAMVLADRLRALIEATRFVYSGKEIPVTMSLGVSAFTPGRHTSGADLVQEADQYLYSAKRGGRNRVAGPA
ncbi:MAG: diguanylate cyclase [Nannocystaceae bacterium]|nr:diguanylate cyclase [bacterium]